MAAQTKQKARGDEQARILAEALPFMQLYDGCVVVIKYGGAAMGDEQLARDFARDVVLLRQSGVRPVIVHGGGKQINTMLEQLNIKTEFRNGLRVTDQRTAEVVEMVLSGHINKKITDDIVRAGGCAVGICGRDGKLMQAKKLTSSSDSEIDDLGFVGQPEKIDTKIIATLLDAGMIPVIAPCASDQQGRVYNINADTAAGALASALAATRLILLTDVIGLLDRDGSLVPKLSAEDAQSLIAADIATDGMRPKIATCIQAVREGVDAAIILDGRRPHALLLELFTAHGVGTMINLRG